MIWTTLHYALMFVSGGAGCLIGHAIERRRTRRLIQAISENQAARAALVVTVEKVVLREGDRPIEMAFSTEKVADKRRFDS